jgi:murein DD-endopeptidase MepM/ murein hydrolase activator NlpD
MGRQRRRAAAVAAAVVVLSVVGMLSAAAQLIPVGPSQEPEPTVTLVPPPSSSEPPPTTEAPSTTTPPPEGGGEPSTTTPDDPSSTVPGDTTTVPGDTTTAPGEPDPADGTGGGGPIPPEAQAAINAIPRTPPNNSQALVEGVAALEAAGVARDEAMAAVYGRFPVRGLARWVDDWHFPRWTGPVFRFHEGLDMIAEFGTPIAAPTDGIVRIANGSLGGLTVKVVEADGSYWYLAHLSGIAEGLIDGAAVTTGQIVGYVGDSGNARGGAPHLHLGRYEGGVALPPKPYIDAFVADGAAQVVELLATLAAAPQPAAVVAADLTRRLADGVTSGPETSGPPRSELLWASAASPNGGAVAVADAAAASLNELVDWDRRGAEQRSLDLAWSHAVDRAWRVVAPMLNPTLRRAVEARQSSRSVPEVGELEGDPEVLALQRGDDGL